MKQSTAATTTPTGHPLDFVKLPRGDGPERKLRLTKLQREREVEIHRLEPTHRLEAHRMSAEVQRRLVEAQRESLEKPRVVARMKAVIIALLQQRLLRSQEEKYQVKEDSASRAPTQTPLTLPRLPGSRLATDVESIH